MQNKFFPLLTQSMIDANPDISGSFYVEERIVLPKNRNEHLLLEKNYIFLKEGLPHNFNGPVCIEKNLRQVYYMKNGLFILESPGLITYQEIGTIVGTKFIPPQQGNQWIEYYDANRELHRLSGPAHRNLQYPKKNHYYIHGKELSKKQWFANSEVIEYFGRILLKKKMIKTFGAIR